MRVNKFCHLPGLVMAFCICCIPFLNAQTGEFATPVLKADATADFTKGAYAEALQKYEILLGRYPRDGVFNYYGGRCLYHLGEKPERAAEMLEFAGSRPDVPADVWYYLGRVYMKLYLFNEAGLSFDKFQKTATKQELRASDSGRWLQYAENAVEHTRSYNMYEVLAGSSFSFSDTGYIRQIYSTGGMLVQKPDELMTSGEEEGSLTMYMFLPRVLNNGDYIHFAGYSKGKKGGSELFRVKYLNGKRWGNMEPLNSLNTPYDELFPYFDPVGNDLYFASEGYNSMGGLDVFKSHYDAERNSWSEPVNLGFPLNSPFDDLLVLPGSDLGSLLLVTGRMGDDKVFTVHRLHMQEPKKNLTSADSKELKRIADFGEITFPSVADISIISPVEKNQVTDSEVPHTPVIQHVEKTELPVSYNKNLKEALSLQFKSDSLANLAREGRLKAKEIADPAARWNLQKNIIEWEKDSRDYQMKADELYRLVKEMESGRTTAKSLTDIKTVVEDTVNISTAEETDAERKVPVFPVPPDEASQHGSQLPPDMTKQSTLTDSPDAMKQPVYTDSREVIPQSVSPDPPEVPKHSVFSDSSETTKQFVSPDIPDVTQQPVSPDTPEAAKQFAVKTVQSEPGEELKPTAEKESSLSRFAILDKSPYSASNPFPVDVSLPAGSFYMIQLGVFSKKVSFDAFGGLSPVTGETIPGRNMTRYYAGKFDRYDEAVKVLDMIKKRGYNDAFVVAWYNGQKMPPAKVKEMERRR